MSDPVYLWSALLVMGLVTAGLRLLPLLAHRTLADSRLAQALNRLLPLAVMVILLVTSLQGGWAAPTQLGLEVVALLLVAFSYLRWRNTMLSVVLGVVVVNLPVWLGLPLG